MSLPEGAFKIFSDMPFHPLEFFLEPSCNGWNAFCQMVHNTISYQGGADHFGLTRINWAEAFVPPSVYDFKTIYPKGIIECSDLAEEQSGLITKIAQVFLQLSCVTKNCEAGSLTVGVRQVPSKARCPCKTYIGGNNSSNDGVVAAFKYGCVEVR